MKYPTYTSFPEAIWFSQLPSSWNAKKMRGLFSEKTEKVSDKDYPALSVGKMGVVPQLESAVKTDNGDNRKLICKNDFAINSRSDRKGACGVSRFDGSCSLIITVLQPRSDLNSRYLHYLLRSHYFAEEFYRNGHGLVSDLWTTKWDEMRNIYLPVPPRPEQDQIVRYIDWKVAQINKLIHGYQREIALIEEKENLQICDLLLHGLDQTVSFINPGIQNIDRIPSHWKVLQSKRLFKERSEFSTKGNETLLSVSKHYGVKRYSDLDTAEQFATIKPAQSLIGYKKVHQYDLAMNIMRARNGSYGISDYDGIVSPAYCVYQLIYDCNPQYIHYLLHTPQIISCFESYSYGIAEHRRRLYPTDFLRLYFPIPPKVEQNKIVERVLEIKSESTIIFDKLKRQITLLREYRTRLISDVVTGQMDVRGIAVPDYIPEEDVEPEREENEEETEMDEDAQ